MGNIFKCRKKEANVKDNKEADVKDNKELNNTKASKKEADEELYFSVWSRIVKNRMKSQFAEAYKQNENLESQSQLFFVDTKLIYANSTSAQSNKLINVKYFQEDFANNRLKRAWGMSNTNFDELESCFDPNNSPPLSSSASESNGIPYYDSDDDDQDDHKKQNDKDAEGCIISTISPTFCNDQFIVTNQRGKSSRCFVEFSNIILCRNIDDYDKKILSKTYDNPLHPRNLTLAAIDEWRKCCENKINTMSILILSSVPCLPVDIIDYHILTFIFPRISDFRFETPDFLFDHDNLV